MNTHRGNKKYLGIKVITDIDYKLFLNHNLLVEEYLISKPQLVDIQALCKLLIIENFPCKTKFVQREKSLV